MSRIVHRTVAVLLALFCALSAPPAMASAEQHRVPVLTVDGVINPLSARYVARSLDSAARDRARFVLIRLDTPGGTMDAMRAIVRAILGSPVPVVVYVAPAGARAASAGVFITAAAHVAAMAPGTNIGAAHPVAMGGDKNDATLETKVVNDAAAMARALASDRGRNADWLERAVRQSVSLTAEEAQRQHVIDLVASSDSELLSRLHGRVLTVKGARIRLDTTDVRLTEQPMWLPERILHVITDPNIAYVLMTLGLLGVVAELYSPGMVLPGVLGGISLILAFVAFGNLPVNWAGVVLLVVGAALIFIDALSAGLGLLAVGGGVALLVGTLFLYRPFGPITPAAPRVSVSPAVVVTVLLVSAAFSGIVLRAMWRTRRAAVRSGPQALVGRAGVATSRLAPSGTVRVDSEAWTAVTSNGVIDQGERIIVVGVSGVTLTVARERGGP